MTLKGPTTALLLALGAAGCASAPVLPAQASGPTFTQKMATILRLEDQRVLHDPPAPAAPPAPVDRKGRPVAAPVLARPAVADLVALLSDGEARVRRRAALAIGHVGLAEGVEPLVTVLGDTDPEVRQMAAFALGLIGSASARDPLIAALGDPQPVVRGSAAEALGLIGDATAAAPIGRMLATLVESGALGTPPVDEDEARRDTPAGAFRLGTTALVRLKAYEPFAAAVLDAKGQPRVKWWPVAFALARFEHAGTLPALVTLAHESNPYTRAFAAKGMAALKDPAALPTLDLLLQSGDRGVQVQTVRALSRIGDPRSAPALLKLLRDPSSGPSLRVEIADALGAFHSPAVFDTVIDLMGDPTPAVRAAALRASAAADPVEFVTVLSGIDADPHWSVRAALATVLGTLSPEAGLARLAPMLDDADQRVVPSVLNALVKLKAPDVLGVLLKRLKADDVVVRVAAANGLGELKPPSGAEALVEAYRFGQRDTTYVARAAALTALTKYGAAAVPTLELALADKDWAVRLRAAQLLEGLKPGSGAAGRIRPVPTTMAADGYGAERLVSPTVSTQLYIDTDKGTIQVELAVLDAPLTIDSLTTLARKGFFNGLSMHRVVPDFVIQGGDPRGDGEGGPGFTVRDEISQTPYLRGTVGIALDWADTGGSQFFITHSPQPHLDSRYTVIGRVVAGMDVVDRIEQWDVIRRIRVWDGS